MRHFRLLTALFACVLGLGAAGLAANVLAQDEGPYQGNGEAHVIELQDSINPATAGWVSSALDDAAAANANLAIITLDTPGGLDSSLREIVQDIFAAPMPVVVYVSPKGARAASAGAYITQAADIAAMAPATNIGSATPIAVAPDGSVSDLDAKIKNDAAASLRGLAETHNRNPEIAAQMVSEALNITAEEALADGFIDVISPNVQQLLTDINGFEIHGPKQQTLDTTGLVIVEKTMTWRYELMSLLVNPNIAYMLLILGLVGIAIEIFTPGTFFPGGLGAISLILGLFGTSQLPVTVAGVVLLLIGISMLIAEAHLPTGGFLGLGGVVALVAGGLLLYDTNTSAVAISPPVIIATGLLLGGFIAFAGKKAVAARTRPIRTGWEEMLGATGDVREAIDPVGQVFVEGALWRARAADGNATFVVGDRVIVESIDGLTLHVRGLAAEDSAPATPHPGETGAPATS